MTDFFISYTRADRDWAVWIAVAGPAWAALQDLVRAARYDKL
jgi:hypothetical protein